MMKSLKKTLREPAGIAFSWAVRAGVITHLFALVNTLHNFDDIGNLPGGYGTGVVSGRWFLEILGLFMTKIGYIYNLPTVNGLIYILLLAISAGLLVSFLKIRGSAAAAMIGMLFVVFPTATSTMFFRFAAPFYGLSTLLAVFAAWVLRQNRFGLLLSALSLCLSMGIYQAYAPLTIGMFVLLLISQSMEKDASITQLIRSGLYDCLALALGVGLYFVAHKACLALWNVEALDYRGINTIGQINLAELPGLICKSFGDFFNILTQDYAGVSVRKSQQWNYCLLALVTAVMIGIVLVRKIRKPMQCLAVCALLALFPVAVNFIVVMCPGNWIYTMMVYSFVLVGCASLVIWEKLPQMEEKLWKKGNSLLTKLLGCLLALLIFSYSYYANTNYMALYYANRQIENYVSSIVTQVRMTEGFDTQKEWVLLGSIDDPLLNCMWEEETTFGGNGFTEYILNHYSQENWFIYYVGYDLPLASGERAAELSKTEAVRQMPCWPNQGSIGIVEDTVVIKFQELSE